MSDKLTMRDVNTYRKKLDNISDDQLREDRQHMSVAYMAQHYGVSKSTMYRALRKAGLVHEEKRP